MEDMFSRTRMLLGDAAMEGMVCGGTMDVLIEDLPVDKE